MFGKLREKLKSWAKKVSEKLEVEKDSSERIEELKEEIKESKKVIEKAKEKHEKEQEKKTEKTKISTPKQEPEKELILPQTFNAGAQKYEPDLEMLEAKADELVEELKNEVTKTEKPKEKEKKKESFFTKIRKVKITGKEFDVYKEELEMLLLENNVALEVTEKIIKRLEELIVGKELLKKEIEGEIFDAFKELIEEILIDPFSVAEKIKTHKKESPTKPFVILFCGINGTGKTTSIAKIAEQLKKENISSVLAAGDTFRAASIEQIKKHGENLGIKVIAQNYGSDPAAVGFDAIKYAEKNRIDTVLIDTAGRMHTEKNLMQEIEKVAKVTKPNLKIFVGESITGNDVIEQAKAFNWAVGIDGIILSKADIDEKGGTALSVGYVTKKPILYLGTGQKYNEIEPFDKKKFIERLGL